MMRGWETHGGGRARMYLGEALAGLRDIGDASVDLVIADSPYSSGGMVRGDRMLSTSEKYQNSENRGLYEEFAGDTRDQRAYGYWCALWVSELLRVSKPGSVCMLFTDWRQLAVTSDALQAGGWVFRGMPLHGFRVIYADPPWRYETWSAKGQDRCPDYPTMSLDAICSMPVAALAERDAVLFLWTSPPFLQASFEVVKAWGFAYKSVAFTWLKVNKGGARRAIHDHRAWWMNMGKWTRGNAEFCLLATRGKPSRLAAAKAVPQIIISERREHSRKPEEAIERIEALVDGPRVELFARTARDGWEACGRDVGMFTAESSPVPVTVREPRQMYFDLVRG